MRGALDTCLLESSASCLCNRPAALNMGLCGGRDYAGEIILQGRLAKLRVLHRLVLVGSFDRKDENPYLDACIHATVSPIAVRT